MKTKTRIDSAGRIVVPIEIRRQYGLEEGSEVEIIPIPDGISIVPIRPKHRLERVGRIVAIKTDEEIADIDVFDISKHREHYLDKKNGFNQ